MRLLILSLVFGLTFSQELKKPTNFLFYKDPEDVRERYEQFKRQYKKEFSNDDDEKRFGIFKENLKRAALYQSLEQGTAEYGVTQFSDLTEEEFVSMYLSKPLSTNEIPEMQTISVDTWNMPESVDWREKGAVNPVEDQKRCGSCWAFSAIGNIEGQWFMKTGELIPLSKQFLVDCDPDDSGCNGGLPLIAYKTIMRLGGVPTQHDYPYWGFESTCKLNEHQLVVYVNDSIRLDTDEKQQAAWLAEHGPLSVAVNANLLQFYIRGIWHPWSFLCRPSGINHAVLTVGYGVEKKTDYWIVKNSWGAGWGEDGYFRIARGQSTCGINQYVTSAIIN